MDLSKSIEKAKSSRMNLRLLNLALTRLIPFNRPHKFKVISLSDQSIKTFLPFRKKNLNHIQSLHACALATLSEFTTGFMLLSRLDPEKYRIILKSLHIDYHYQGKTDAVAEFSIDEAWLKEKILDVLELEEAAVVECKIDIYDIKQNLLSTARVHWQLKEWKKVKTKLN